MYPRLFLAILPVLLGSTFAPSLALPVQLESSHTLSIGARSFDLSSGTTPLVSHDISTELLVERGYEDDGSDVLSRVINEVIFPRANTKRTAEEVKQRKEDVRNTVKTNQARNAARKIDLQAKAAELTKPYGKPRKLKYTKETTPKGKEHITGGYRKDGRDKGYRLAKQPKTPKPNFAKGDQKTNAKFLKKQSEQKDRLKAKKAAGRNAHATANARYADTLAHGNMPKRDVEYNVPNHGVLHGKDVRTGAYNLGMHEGQGGRYPVKFRNAQQGLPGNRQRPLPHMVGSGHEYPINNAKNGYHPHQADQGPVRAVYQDNPNGGYDVKGVISHDVTLPDSNDHHQINGVAPPVHVPDSAPATPELPGF